MVRKPIPSLNDDLDITSMSERAFQKIVEAEAVRNGWKFHHCNDTGRCSGGSGFFDLIAIRNGEILAAELKAEGGKLAHSQVQWAREYPASKLWYPSDAEQILQTLT